MSSQKYRKEVQGYLTDDLRPKNEGPSDTEQTATTTGSSPSQVEEEQTETEASIFLSPNASLELANVVEECTFCSSPGSLLLCSVGPNTTCPICKDINSLLANMILYNDHLCEEEIRDVNLGQEQEMIRLRTKQEVEVEKLRVE